MQARERTGSDRAIPEEGRLTSLIGILAPGDEAALQGAAQAIAGWDGVRCATIEVQTDRAGRAPLVVTAGAPWSLPRAAAPLCLDLLDRAEGIGRLVVELDESTAADQRLPAACEAAAALVSTAAARCRLDAMLLDAQSFEVAGQIASGLVHDFNNMLTGIAGNAAIAHALLRPEDRALVPVQRIEDAARSASAASRALLNFVRGTLERTELSVNELATATRRVLSNVVRDGVTLDLDLGQDVPPVVGEQALLQQALVNLVMNASQAISGDGVVTFSTRLVACVPPGAQGTPDAASSYVALAVSDTGSGIAPEHRDELFRPFFTTKRNGGTGLGLVSVLHVAKRHGGAVGVESAPGAGTTFTLYLPVGPAAPGRPAEVSGGQPDTRGRKRSFRT